MPWIVFLPAFLGALYACYYFMSRHCGRRDLAMGEFHDLYNLVIQLLESDSLSIPEWRSWLPICRFADARFRERCNPHLPDESTCEYFVLLVLARLQGRIL